ncbi:tautomerase family protein [Clostridia bacterium]|nr:tautomerase family protein [Clostridia bacterium]
MPIIEVNIREQSYETRKAIAKRITDVIVEETNHPAHAVTVLFKTANPDYVSSGGEMLDEILKKQG